MDAVAYAAWAMILAGICSFFTILFVPAPYGRYSGSRLGKVFGTPISGRLAWIVQESPCIIAVLLYLINDKLALIGVAKQILVGLFTLHYLNR